MLLKIVSSNSSVSCVTSADLTAKLTESHVGQRHAVEANFAGVGIGKTRNQIGQRALAAAVRADDGDRFAERNAQAHILQHRFAGLVGETHVLEFQVAIVPPDGYGMLRIANGRFAFEPGEDAVAGGAGGLQAAEDVGHFSQRIGHAGQKAKNNSKVAAAQWADR